MNQTRRDWFAAAAGAALTLTRIHAAPATDAPTAPVSVVRCHTYNTSELGPAMEKLFDGIGGLGRVVAGKTVAIKINLTGSGSQRMGYTPAELAQWTHPAVIGVTTQLMFRAGAKRVRLLECGFQTADPLEELMYEAAWDPRELLNAGPRVEMENTNWLGSGSKYHKFTPARGGHLFREYWLNHSYADCDVFVSLAKLKEHATAGVTLSMKNCFGMTPCTIYGDRAPEGEASRLPQGGRGAVFHNGARQPGSTAPKENDPNSPRQGGYRVPRAVADLVSARPIHLGILDGIDTMSGGEGPWIRGVMHVQPGLLIAGTNCVTTDAVSTAIMGYDPMAERGTAPFQTCDNTMQLAEELGVGTRDLRRIEVVGLSIDQARFEFAKYRAPSRRRRG